MGTEVLQHMTVCNVSLFSITVLLLLSSDKKLKMKAQSLNVALTKEKMYGLLLKQSVSILLEKRRVE